MPSPIRVLFLCTGNSCRSQMAEGILRHLGGERFEVCSAGSHPAGYVHPLAVEAMRDAGIDISGQQSKSWDEVAERWFDLVITLCDSAAAEECPNWPGGPVTAHWSLPDPVGARGTDAERLTFCRAVAGRLAAKIGQLIASPLEEMTTDQISTHVRWIAGL